MAACCEAFAGPLHGVAEDDEADHGVAAGLGEDGELAGGVGVEGAGGGGLGGVVDGEAGPEAVGLVGHVERVADEGKATSERAPRARMAAMAVEDSRSSASMVPWMAMMAETPQTELPTASRVVSLSPRPKRRPSQVIKASERTSSMKTRRRERPPSLAMSPRTKRAPSRMMPALSQNS